MNSRSGPRPRHQTSSAVKRGYAFGPHSHRQLLRKAGRSHLFASRPHRQLLRQALRSHVFEPRPSDRSPRTAERGYVTAETAMVLPTLVGLGLALVLIVVAAAAQLRCTDAAWEAARGLARGEPSGYAAQAVQRFGPAGASTEVSSADGSVLVRVSARLPIGNALLPAIHVVGHAQIACEPGSPCADDGIDQEVR